MTRRLDLLAFQERGFRGEVGNAEVGARQAVTERAVSLMRSRDRVAFDLADESQATFDRYGDSDFGRGCLLARRLVERGSRLVEVTLDGWDTHRDNFERSRALMEALDPAMSGLLDDLAERQLLDATLVVCLGEFGRSPDINANDGRDHHPGAWSAVLAGGGVRGGIVHGATDARGATVIADPVAVPELFATIAAQLGIAPDTTAFAPSGRPVAISGGAGPVAALVGR